MFASRSIVEEIASLTQSVMAIIDKDGVPATLTIQKSLSMTLAVDGYDDRVTDFLRVFTKKNMLDYLIIPTTTTHQAGGKILIQLTDLTTNKDHENMRHLAILLGYALTLITRYPLFQFSEPEYIYKRVRDSSE